MMLDLGKYSNWKSARSQHFQFEYFPRFNIVFKNRLPTKSLIIMVLNLFVELLDQYSKQSKNRFPLAFFKTFLRKW